jgi:hypothetical protein
MDRDIPAKLDGACYEALRSVMDDLTSPAHGSEQPVTDRWASPSFDAVEVYI